MQKSAFMLGRQCVNPNVKEAGLTSMRQALADVVAKRAPSLNMGVGEAASKLKAKLIRPFHVGANMARAGREATNAAGALSDVMDNPYAKSIYGFAKAHPVATATGAGLTALAVPTAAGYIGGRMARPSEPEAAQE
jgi:hypothetical protein